MKRIVHISDTHFGRVNERTIEPLLAKTHELKPDVVVVSGDLTQHASKREFAIAKHFLDLLPKPVIVVPGNHDVPIFNPVHRFIIPLAKYRRYITRDLTPYYEDDEMAVMGVNTATGLLIDGGRIRRDTLLSIRSKMAALPETMAKIVVTHHPFDLPEEIGSHKLVKRARKLLGALSKSGADIFLAGHLHVGWSGNTYRRHDTYYQSLVIQAGTATSSRGRKESNSFNMIEVEASDVAVERFHWKEASGKFTSTLTDRFTKTERGWHPVGAARLVYE